MMTIGQKVLFGVLVFLPWILIALIEIELFVSVDRILDVRFDELWRHLPTSSLQKIVLLMGIIVICNLTALILHCIHLFRNKDMEDGRRITWLLVLLLTGIVGQTIYFFKFILKSRPAAR